MASPVLFDPKLVDNFLEAAETLSFSRAAERRGMSQPRFSLLMKRLETQLGFDLFLRVNRKVSLTPEGEILLERFRAMKDAINAVEDAIWKLRSETRTRLRLGSPRYMTSIPQRNWLVTELCARHPSVALELDDDITPVMLARLRDGVLDATLATGPFDTDGLDTILVASARPMLAIPTHDPLAARESLTLADLDGMVIVTRRRGIGQQYMKAWYGPLQDAGAVLLEGPEDHPGSLLEFAARKDVATLVHQWSNENLESTTFPHKFVFRPLLGADVNMEIHLARLAKTQNVACQWLWNIASEALEMLETPRASRVGA
jgi:DNA-binding transcriptional LysR family regulator